MLFLFVLLGVSIPAEASELSTGISFGGLLAGTVPHLAVSPYVGMSWRMNSGLILTAHGMISILVPNNDGVGIYGQISPGIGYAWEMRNFSVGPSLAVYFMTACGTTLCGRVGGVAPGGHVQVTTYFYGPFGVSVNANVDWIGGRSLVLPGSVAMMVVAGPVMRWTGRNQ